MAQLTTYQRQQFRLNFNDIYVTIRIIDARIESILAIRSANQQEESMQPAKQVVNPIQPKRTDWLLKMEIVRIACLCAFWADEMFK